MTDDQRCLTCKWWRLHDEGDNGECVLAESNDGKAMFPRSLAEAWDTESYHAGLTTAPDFGCVQWEKKSDA